MADVKIFLTTGSSWTVPADCQSATIEAIGGGGTGGSASGGGGGAYSKKNSLLLTPADSISYQVGGVATDTWFKSISDVLAKGGQNGSSNTPGAGGLYSSCVGDVKYSGGNGAAYSGSEGGGGGAAGLNGSGNNASTYFGGSGDSGYGGYGGYSASYGKDGGNGTEWDSTHGSGGGGGGDSLGYGGGGTGGLYGGGGAAYGGAGKQGLIIITYTPTAPGTSKFFQLF